MTATQFKIICLCFVIIIFFIRLISGLEVIPEQAGIIYGNPQFATDIIFTVRRYKRRSPYVVNIQAVLQQTWGNNISVHYIFYEYLHNEYKRSFVEMNYKLCDMFNKDPIFSPVVKNSGIRCPMSKGFLNLPNLTMINVPAVDNLPYKWPFEKAKVVAIFKRIPGNEKIVEAYLIASFKQTAKKKS